MPSGFGFSGFSQASVQSLRSMRQGLPVQERERTVSWLVALSSDSCCAGGVSASSTVSQSEPVQTPCAPSISAAAICRPSPMPPAASTGSGATASITCGQSTTLPMSPVWPPPSPPCAITKSTPAALCASACLTLPHSAPTRRPEAWISLITSAGGVPSALATTLHLRVLEDHLDLRARGGGRPAEQLARLLALGQLGHAVLGEQVLREGAVLGGDHLAQLLLERAGVEVFALPVVLAGDHDVDAVGLVADVLVDPLELDLELLGAEADGAEHAEAAGLADRDDDVAAVGEGEDRELDAESLAELGLHGGLLGWIRKLTRKVKHVPVAGWGRRPAALAGGPGSAIMRLRGSAGGTRCGSRFRCGPCEGGSVGRCAAVALRPGHSRRARRQRGPGRAPELLLATTTSVRDSGLLDAILPPFTREDGHPTSR